MSDMSLMTDSESLPETQTKKLEMNVKVLPDGWRRKVVPRKYGHAYGMNDVYYYR